MLTKLNYMFYSNKLIVWNKLFIYNATIVQELCCSYIVI